MDLYNMKATTEKEKSKFEMLLTEQELVELTNRKRRDSQGKSLSYMGITYRVRPDGSLAVLRDHVTEMLGGKILVISEKKRTEPNWSALSA